MNYKQKLFVYQRREMFVFALLILMGSAFTFTLGVHLTKGVFHRSYSDLVGTGSLKPTTEVMPNKEELNDPGKNAHQIVEDTLNQQLHDEVTRTGIKLHPSHEIELPKRPKSPEAGATRLKPSH